MQPSNNFPIGIMDSGTGGLTIWKQLTKYLPHESTVYIGDHGHLPYGDKSTRQIRQRAHVLLTFLVSKKVKLIVIACNAATVAGIDWYRKKFPNIPIIGVVPVIKTATQVTKTKHIAILATPYTTASAYQKKLIQAFATGSSVHAIAIPRLVRMIEQGNAHSVKAKRLLQTVLRPVADHNIDVIALGCTHYPFVASSIRAIVGKKVKILDSAKAVSRHVFQVLDIRHLAQKRGTPSYQFFTTGDASLVSKVATNLLHMPTLFSYETAL